MNNKENDTNTDKNKSELSTLEGGTITVVCFPYNKHETNRNDIEPHERSSLYSDKNRTHKSTHFGGKHAHISALVGNREDLFRTLRFHSQMLLTQHNTNNQKNTLQNRESVNEEGKSFYHYPKTCAAIKCYS